MDHSRTHPPSGPAWTVTELLAARDHLLDLWGCRTEGAYPVEVPLMLGDVYRDLAALLGPREASLAMIGHDQETGRCPATTT